MPSPYRVPIDQLERERVPRSEQVVLIGDGAVPPPVHQGLPAGDDGADGDGD